MKHNAANTARIGVQMDTADWHGGDDGCSLVLGLTGSGTKVFKQVLVRCKLPSRLNNCC